MAANYRATLQKEMDTNFKSMAKNGGFGMNEHDVWAQSIAATHGVPNQDGVSSCYRCPMKGEPVTVTGMCRRSDLNGARGEIIDGNMDERGRIAVNIFKSSVDPDRGSRRMMIQCKKLVPGRSGLIPLTQSRPPLPDECSSAASLSRVGSIAASSVRSRGSRRGTGSVKGADNRMVELQPEQPEPPPPSNVMRTSESAPVLLGQSRSERLKGIHARAVSGPRIPGGPREPTACRPTGAFE